MPTPCRGQNRKHGSDRDWTIGALLEALQTGVEAEERKSLVFKALWLSTWIMPIILVLLNRVLRIVLVGNFWATEDRLGPMVAVFNMVSLLINTTIWWHESES